MDLADRDWRLITEESRPGPLNMALDETAAETAAEEGTRMLRVYRWDPSALSLGYHQDPGTIDWKHCDSAGITVTRRPTGGGAIYHDNWGDISYSIVAPADELPGDLMESYELLCEPLLDAFERMGIDAGFADEERPAVYQPACYLRALHPAHDVVAGDGRKISGNAQYRQRDAVVQHGSITFESTTERHLSCFADPDATAPAFDDRVTSVHEQSGISRQTAVAELTEALRHWADACEATWSDEELSRAHERASEKYKATAWTRDGEEPTA